MNNKENQTKEQKLIDKYKMLYSKYNYLKELQDNCFTHEEIKKDVIIRGPLLGISLLTIIMSVNQDLSFDTGIAILISTELSSILGGGALRDYNYEIRINDVKNKLLSLANKLKIVSSNMCSFPYYVVYENKDDYSEHVSVEDKNIVNAYYDIDTTLGAAYQIACKR